MATSTFKTKIIKLSATEFAILSTTGTLTKDGVTYTYSPTDVIYVTPDITSVTIEQTTGQSTTNVMSQKAVTDELSGKQNKKATATVTDSSTTALADNTEYTGTNLSTVTFTYPQGDFECYLSLSFASSGTITVTFPTSQYIGNVPTFENGKTYEISIRNGVIVAGEVTSGA